MLHVTHPSMAHGRTRPARLTCMPRLAVAAEPLERRLLLSSAVVNTTADVTHAPGSAVVSLRDAIASDVLQNIPDKAIETSLETLQDIKERIKGLAEPGDIAAK